MVSAKEQSIFAKIFDKALCFFQPINKVFSTEANQMTSKDQ
jgi:hypothetical protein